MAYSQTLANFIPEVWSKKLAKLFDDKFFMKKLVNTDYEGEIKDYGDTVHVPYLGNVTVNDYDNTGTPPITYASIDDNTSTLSINQRKYWAFVVEDIEQAMANVKGLQGKYMERAAVALKDTVETWLLGSTFNGAAGNTLDYTTGGVAKLSATNMYSALVAARKLMAQDNTWVDGGMSLMINPAIEELILTSSELTHATDKADELIRNGSIGRLAGWNLYVSNNLAGAGTDLSPWKMMGFNKDFISFAEAFVKTRAMDLEDQFAVGVSGLMVYGAAVLTPYANCGVTIDVEI